MNNEDSVVKLSKEEAMEIMETNAPVKTGPWKYGYMEYYVFERNGKHFSFNVCVHNSEGWQLQETVVAHRVKPVEKTIIEWERY